MKTFFKFLRFGASAFFGLIILLMVLSKFAKPENEDPKSKEESLKKLEQEYASLAEIKSKVLAPSALKQKTCPDAEIEDKISSPSKKIEVWPIEFFSVFEGGTAWKDIKKDWQWLKNLETFSPLSELKSTRDINNALWNTSIFYKERPYMGILTTSQKIAPKIQDDENFVSGLIEGWVVVIDTSTKTAICQVPLLVQNSEQIKFKTRGLLSQGADEAILSDFKNQYAIQLKQALEKISQKLTY